MAQKGPLALRLWKFKTAYLEGSETPVNDLAFLARHRETLRHLHVHGDQLLDVGQVNQLTALETATIDAPATRPLELRRLRRLSSLVVVRDEEDGGNALVIDWTGAPQLLSVELDPATADDIAALEAQTALEEVDLSNPARLPDTLPGSVYSLSLAGVIPAPTRPLALPALEELDLLDVSGLRDFTFLAGSGALSRLEVFGAIGLVSLAGLRFEPGAHVYLGDCPDLVDISALDGVPQIDLEIRDCPHLPQVGE